MVSDPNLEESFDPERFLAGVASSMDGQRLFSVCFNALAAFGGDKLSYHHHPPIGSFDFTMDTAIVATGFPEEWVETYRARKYFRIDPIISRAQNSTKPFWWSEVEADRTRLAVTASFLVDLRAQVPGDGLAIPVFGPNGRNGYAGLGFSGGKIDLEPAYLLRLQSICNAAHLRYCEISDGERFQIGLSPRETETIKLIAKGMSNVEIAEFMGISPATAGTNVRRVFSKLQVNDRTSASLRALSLGYIYY